MLLNINSFFKVHDELSNWDRSVHITQIISRGFITAIWCVAEVCVCEWERVLPQQVLSIISGLIAFLCSCLLSVIYDLKEYNFYYFNFSIISLLRSVFLLLLFEMKILWRRLRWTLAPRLRSQRGLKSNLRRKPRRAAGGSSVDPNG